MRFHLFMKKRDHITYIIGFAILALMLVVFSCRKDDIIDEDPSRMLSFSADTVIFDTVFTTVGSATGGFKVYNPGKNKLIIQRIRLAGGDNSPYKINIDGTPASMIEDVEIRGEDSLYIFVRVKIDPNDDSNPFIVTDSILFETNGNLQDIDLVAYGQNAHFYTNTIYQVNGTWESDLPHVIYGFVIVDSLYTLQIMPGTKVYLHRGSVLAVAEEATLKVNGTREEPVVFQGDRLEEDYQDLPGQWGAIWLSAGSKNNEIHNAIIRNGTIGIRVDTLGNSPEPTLTLSNTHIYNMTGYGLLAQGSYVNAANCIFSGCGQSAVVLALGGTYDFRHCTIGNYYSFNFRETSSLVLNNYYLLVNDLGFVTDTIPRDLYNAYFGNCIIYGNQDNEIFKNSTNQALFQYRLENCLIKTESVSDPNYVNCLFNEDPLFADVEMHDYSIDTLISPVIDRGLLDVVTGSPSDITYDFAGNDRTVDAAPDPGAFEFVESKLY